MIGRAVWLLLIVVIVGTGQQAAAQSDPAPLVVVLRVQADPVGATAMFDAVMRRELRRIPGLTIAPVGTVRRDFDLELIVTAGIGQFALASVATRPAVGILRPSTPTDDQPARPLRALCDAFVAGGNPADPAHLRSTAADIAERFETYCVSPAKSW